MNNLNVIELTDKTELSSSERTAYKYRLDEINKIRDYFNNKIKERKDIIKKLNKYLVIVLVILIKYLLLCQHHLVR